jgi:hypothetical protein
MSGAWAERAVCVAMAVSFIFAPTEMQLRTPSSRIPKYKSAAIRLN